MKKAFCDPAEARIVEIFLRELQPQDGQTCASSDAMLGFYDMVPEVLLTPGIVIPSNCTINRLIDYSCRENFGFYSGTRQRARYRPSSKSSTQGALINIRTLILCNACNVVNPPSPIPMKRFDKKIIDQQELATTFGNAGRLFSVQAFEKFVSKRKRTRRSHRSRYNYCWGSFFCGDEFLSSRSTTARCGQ